MNKELEKIVKLIRENDKIAIFHHVLPDGDSVSSSYALLLDLREKFPNKEIYWMPDTEYLNKRFWYIDFDQSTIIDKIDESWLAIIGDTSGKDRVYNSEWYMKAGKKIIYDHHRNDTDIENYDVFWHEPTFPASAMQSWMIAEALEVEMDEERALLHWLGLNTDTYRFSYSFANPLPLRMAADMFEYISDQRMQKLYQAMEQKTLEGLKFQGWVYENFKLEENVAFLEVHQEDLDKLNIKSDDAARVNMIGNIKGVKAWLFFIQYPDFIRVEFRSHNLPVNAIAQEFGGGGHLRAAGAKANDWETVKKIVQRVKEKSKNY